MNHLLLCLLLLVSACATYNKTIMPSGEAGYSVSCDGSMVGMNVCYEKAAVLCPYGYDIHNTDKNSGWIASNSFAGSVSTKGILVSCKSAFTIRCPASENDLSGCDVKAKEVCPSGHRTLKRDELKREVLVSCSAEK